jgi:membrane protein DedA with SNARE-associated domain
MSLAYIISTFGYPAVLIGALLEGETVLILAGFFAFMGYMQLPWVILTAFVGTYGGDQLFYFTGKLKGRGIISNRPAWKLRAEKVLTMVTRHQILMILGFRFIWGIRAITPFLFGAIGVKTVDFLLWNTIGAVVWSIAITLLGYYFGSSLQLILGEIKKYEFWIFIGAILISSGIMLIRLSRQLRQAKVADQTGGNAVGKGEEPDCGV